MSTKRIYKITFGDVVQKNGAFYFHGKQLRQPVAAMHARLCGVDDTKKINVWFLRCKTPECDGLCRYYSGSIAKGVDHEKCEKCYFADLGKIFEVDIDGVVVSRKVIRGTWDQYYGKPKYYVACDRCPDDYTLDSFLGPQRRTCCQSCHRKTRLLFGHVVSSKYVWSQRHRIVGVIVRPGARQGNIAWKVKCANTGCDNSCEMRKNKKIVCAKCRADARSGERFAGLYKAHLRQDATRQIKQPNYPPSELTFEQFATAMENNICHYCKTTVPRNARTKHTTSSGKRMTTSVFLDRLDSRLPYKQGNIATCCVSCNILKGAYLTETEMQYIIARRHGLTKDAEIANQKLSAAYTFRSAKSIGCRRKVQ